jgi:hypothetical protein
VSDEPKKNEYILHPAPQLNWLVDAYGITLIEKKTGKVHYLNYPEAAIWDLMTRNYTSDRIIAMLSAILSLKQEKAEPLFFKTIKEWSDKGLLIKESNNG